MLTADRVLDNYFLETRSMLLEIAATLDRYDAARTGARAGGARRGSPDPATREDGAGGRADPRLEKLYQSLQLLADPSTPPNRAERLLRLFSDPVD